MRLARAPKPAWMFAALAFVLVSIAIAALWPFGPPANDVAWLPDHGVRIGKHGTMLSSGALPARDVSSCTIEMLVRPATEEWGTLLAFYGAPGIPSLSLNQSLPDLRVDFERGRELFFDNILRKDRTVAIAVLLDGSEVAVYADGQLVREVRGVRLPAGVCSGPFVVADSATDPNTWPGELYMLAIHQERVPVEHIRSMAARPHQQDDARPDALYLFSERSGATVRDQGRSGGNLTIPARYTVVQPKFLAHPAESFRWVPGYRLDLLINVAGFIPLGLIVAAMLPDAIPPLRRTMLAVAVGAGVSLTVEILQSFLPTRNSDLTDVLTNALGTWIGAILTETWRRTSAAWSGRT